MRPSSFIMYELSACPVHQGLPGQIPAQVLQSNLNAALPGNFQPHAAGSCNSQVDRSMSCAPSSVSSAEMWALTVGWVRYRASAAREKLRRRATCTKTSNCLSCTVQPSFLTKTPLHTRWMGVKMEPSTTREVETMANEMEHVPLTQMTSAGG